MLEPVMRLQTVVPESNFGAVQGSLMSKRAMITDTKMHGNMRVIDANVPLVEMFGYSSEIRSLTAGRGNFTMEPLAYEKLPEQLADKIIL
jgi:elongation factor G